MRQNRAGMEVRRIGDEIANREAALNAIKDDLNNLMIGLPNLPHDSAPIGSDESANQEIKRWGTPRVLISSLVTTSIWDVARDIGY